MCIAEWSLQPVPEAPKRPVFPWSPLTGPGSAAGPAPASGRSTWPQPTTRLESREACLTEDSYISEITILWRSRSHRPFRSGESEQSRGETAATSSSSPGNVRPAAPAAESAPKLWNCTGTSQTGTATPDLARRETRRLAIENTSIKP